MMRWDQDTVVSNHRNVQATAMSIDCTGSLAVLGSKRSLVVVELDNPTVVKDQISIGSNFDLSHVVWNPSESHRHYFLTTYSQQCDVWQYGNQQSADAKLLTLSGHTRAISDSNWSYAHPNMLATCSLDSYICLWDIREPKRPNICMSTVAGASQIKWNKRNDYNIASAHDGNIRIWDVRTPKSPVHCIMAHVQNIYSLDWSPLSANTLVSASQDRSICFWDVLSNDATFRIDAKNPVWRIQYNPNHHSVTGVCFKNVRETSICIWDPSTGAKEPQTTFANHVDVVLDMHWRKHREKNLWQLVTWSKDRGLRFCQPTCDFSIKNAVVSKEVDKVVDDSDLKMVKSSEEALDSGNNRADEENQSHVAPAQKFRTKSYSLDSELNSVKLSNFPGIQIEETSASSRFCIARVTWESAVFKMHIKFPRRYPLAAPPKFDFTTLTLGSSDGKIKDRLAFVCRQTAQNCRDANMVGYLKLCMQAVSKSLQHMEFFVNSHNHQSSTKNNLALSDDVLKLLKRIPYPRTCGARFCGAGYLSVFVSPTAAPGHKTSQGHTERTPKSMKSLISFQSSNYFIGGGGVDKDHYIAAATPGQFQSFTPQGKRTKRVHHKSLTMYYDSKQAHLNAAASNRKLTRRVSIFDMNPYLPISRTLSAKYQSQISSDMCEVNKRVAQDLKHPHLERLWSFLELMPDPQSVRRPLRNQLATHFLHTPSGSRLISRLFDHYAQHKDVQTLAMMAPFHRHVVPHVEVKTTKRKEKAKRKEVQIDHPEKILEDQQSATLTPKTTRSRASLPRSARTLVSNFRPTIAHHPRQLSNPEHMAVGGGGGGAGGNFRNSFESTKSLKLYPQTVGVLPSSFELDEDNEGGDNEVSDDDIDVTDSTVIHKDDQAHQENAAATMGSKFDTAVHLYSDYLDRTGNRMKGIELKKCLVACNRLTVTDRVIFNFVKPRNSLNLERRMNKHVDLPSVFRCAVCQLIVKTAFSLCIRCDHGGHMDHIREWFETTDECPTGSCSCRCSSSSSLSS